jgi:hypothetical protein
MLLLSPIQQQNYWCKKHHFILFLQDFKVLVGPEFWRWHRLIWQCMALAPPWPLPSKALGDVGFTELIAPGFLTL